MDNDESGMTGQDFKIPVGRVDKAIAGRDLFAAGEDDISMTLTCLPPPPVVSTIPPPTFRPISALLRAAFGKFHDTLIGTGQGHNEPTKDGKPAGPAPWAMPPGPLPGMKDLDTPKNLGLTLKDTTITGIISSATQKYRDGLTLIDESNRRKCPTSPRPPRPPSTTV